METEKKSRRLDAIKFFRGFFLGKNAGFINQEDQSEDMFQSFARRKESRKKIRKILGITFVFVMIFGVAAVLHFRGKNSDRNAISENVVKIEIPQNQDHVFANDVSGVMSNESSAENNSTNGLVGTSENYQIKDIAIGGANVVLGGGNESLPLKVSDVRSETLMSKDGKEMKMLVWWKTNKLAESEVNYSKSENGIEKSLKEDGYGFSHALVMNNLEQGTRYLFTVRASDRSGNTDVSDQLAVFTGTKPVSVFQLIASQFGDIFGWAMKK